MRWYKSWSIGHLPERIIIVTDFIPGLELNELFYKELVAPILKRNFQNIKYSAALIGWGSEVLGYDDAQSTDHNWGLRFQIFLSNEDANK